MERMMVILQIYELLNIIEPPIPFDLEPPMQFEPSTSFAQMNEKADLRKQYARRRRWVAAKEAVRNL